MNNHFLCGCTVEIINKTLPTVRLNDHQKYYILQNVIPSMFLVSQIFQFQYPEIINTIIRHLPNHYFKSSKT
jgi:hypothetical protein